MMFSDLEDDDPSESKMGKSIEGEGSSNPMGIVVAAPVNDESVSKASKILRKKSVMSYGLSHLEEINEEDE